MLTGMATRFPAPWAYRDESDGIVVSDATGRDLFRIRYNRWEPNSVTLRRHEAIDLAEWLVRFPAVMKAIMGMVWVMRGLDDRSGP